MSERVRPLTKPASRSGPTRPRTETLSNHLRTFQSIWITGFKAAPRPWTAGRSGTHLLGHAFESHLVVTSIVRDVPSWAPGARVIVGGFPAQGGRVGHYFNVVNVDGRVVFLDFQQGRANPADPRWKIYYLMRTN
ncbi:hypothetical protein [Streptomyces triculaminicus]|uniref:hypothetical protein n=1 Tax=Streptomyces triculaminicus TaxID=2816232 RepID=UPI0037A34E9D